MIHLTNILLGSFVTYSSKIAVTDPIYRPDTWCQAIMNVVPGVWNSCIQLQEKDNKKIIYSFTSQIAGMDINPKSWELAENEIGVDSGILGMYDADSYLSAWENDNSDKLLFLEEKENVSEYGTVGPSGVLCNLGKIGENYNLYVARRSNGQIVGVKVKFVY